MANTYTTGVDGYNASTPRYNSLINKVYDWANRDLQALPPQVVRDSVRYAVDTAYRTLRIPPLENTVVYTNFPGVYTYENASGISVDVSIADQTGLQAAMEANPGGSYAGPLNNATVGGGNIYQSVTGLSIPSDLIEFIHIRGRDANGLTTRVFNEKTDIRSFWDICNNNYNQAAFWSRQGDRVVLTPSFGNAARGFYGGGAGQEVALEMYYYRRQSALDAQFNVVADNFNAQGEAGQLMEQVATPSDISAFLAENGNGALWFADNRGITVENYRANFDIRLVRSIAEHSDGGLWFHGPSIDYAITAANYAAGGRVFQTFSEAASQGTLWFPSQSARDRITVTQIRSTFTTTRPIIDPDTGNQDRGAIDIVARIRDGSYQVLPEDTGTGDQPPDTWRFRQVDFDGTGLIQVSGLSLDDVIEIDYFTPPTEPTGTAEDNQNAANSLTPFFFRGHTNFDLADPNVLNQMGRDDIRVSTDPDNFFDTELRFAIDGSIPDPVPGVDVAFDSNTDPSTREVLYFTGVETSNWFKDENEKIPLMGALAECFAYLQEDDQAQKYLQLFQKEITDLNDEDRQRDSSGGNIQTQYTAYGLI